MKRDYTTRQLEVIDFLEQLVHNRFSKESLEKKLSDFFEEPIEIVFSEDDILSDYNLMFNLEREDQYGYFDIYVLPMRKKSFDGSNMYITEIAYEFD
jgi:hypothetical protein